MSPQKMTNLFCIKNSIDDEVFVGSTTASLESKMKEFQSKHNKGKMAKMNICQLMVKHGFENFFIELLEQVDSVDDEVIKPKLKSYILEVGTLNKVIPNRTQEQWLQDHPNYLKSYKEANKDKIKQQKRDWYLENKDKCVQNLIAWKEKNKEHRAEYAKEYQNRNTEKLCENRKEVIECDCGAVFTRASKARHLKTEWHQSNSKGFTA